MEKKFSRNAKRRITKDKMLFILEDEVFQDEDFKRHVKETAYKENIPEDVAETIIKKYITDNALELIKFSKKPRRFVLFGFVYIDVIEPEWNENSIYSNKLNIKKDE